MSEQRKLPQAPLMCSAAGFPYNGEHIEYWKIRAKRATDEVASLRAQLDDYRTVATVRERYVGELQAQLASARKALERLACRHVKGTPLWWQREAREAVSSLSDEKGKTK